MNANRVPLEFYGLMEHADRWINVLLIHVLIFFKCSKIYEHS